MSIVIEVKMGIENQEHYEFLMRHNKTTKDFIIRTLGYLGHLDSKSVRQREFLCAMIYAAYMMEADDKKIPVSSFCTFEQYGIKYEKLLKYINGGEPGYVNEKNLKDTAIKYFEEMCDGEKELSLLDPYHYINQFLHQNKLLLFLKTLGVNVKKRKSDIQNNLDRILDIRNIIVDELEGEYYKDILPSTKQYLEYVAIIFFEFLRNHRTIEDSKKISMILALYLMDDDIYDYRSIASNILKENYKIRFESLFDKFFVGNVLYLKEYDTVYGHLPHPVTILYSYFPEYNNTTKSPGKLLYELCEPENSNIFNVVAPMQAIKHIARKLGIENEELIKREIDSFDDNLKMYLKNITNIYFYLKEERKLDDNKLLNYSKLICSYYMNLDLSKYFMFNGITIDKIYDIDLEQIKGLNYSDMQIDVFKKLDLLRKEIDVDGLDYKKLDEEYRSFLKEIFERETGKIFKDDLVQSIDDCRQELELIENQKRINKYVGLDISVYKYLQSVEERYLQIQKLDILQSDKEFLALILPIFELSDYKNGLLIEYLKSINLSSNKIINYYEIGRALLTNKVVLLPNYPFFTIISKYFDKYIFDGSDNITIENILRNAFNKEIVCSFNPLQILKENSIDISVFENLEEKLKILDDEIGYKNMQYIIRDKVSYYIFKRAYAILKSIEKDLPYQIYHNTNRDISLLLSFLTRDRKNLGYRDERLSDFYDSLFDEYCIDIEYILESVGYRGNMDFSNIHTYDVSDEMIYQEYSEYIESILFENIGDVEEERDIKSHEYNMGYIVRRLFRLNKGITIYDIVHDYSLCCSLEKSVNEEKICKVEIPYDRLFNYLKNEQRRVSRVNINDNYSINRLMERRSNCLTKYSSYCVTLMKGKIIPDTTLLALQIMEYISMIINSKGEFTEKFFNEDTAHKNVTNNICDLSEKLNQELKVIDKVSKKMNRIKELFYEYVKLYEIYYRKYMDKFNTLKEDDELYIPLQESIASCESSFKLLKAQDNHISMVIEEIEKSKNIIDLVTNTLIPILMTIKLVDSNNESKKILQIKQEMLQDIYNFMGALVNYDFEGATMSVKKLQHSNLPKEYIDVLNSGIIKILK